MPATGTTGSFQDLLCAKCFWVQVELTSFARVPLGELQASTCAIGGAKPKSLVKSMVDVEGSLAYWEGSISRELVVPGFSWMFSIGDSCARTSPLHINS